MITTMMWVIIVIIILVLLMILVLKMTKKYHITWYWCQNIRDNIVGKKGSTNSGRGLPLPPFSGNARKKTFFLSGGLPLCLSLAIISKKIPLTRPSLLLALSSALHCWELNPFEQKIALSKLPLLPKSIHGSKSKGVEDCLLCKLTLELKRKSTN